MNKTPKIIILDDDVNIRKTTADILRAKGFEPIPLRLGKKAIERVRSEDIDVVLLDLRLEDMHGLEVLRQIREISPSTECILLTGYASQDSAIEAINLGAYSYYQKPFKMEQLLLSIRHAAEKRAAARALAESQARYQTFINATADLVFLKDENFRYLLVNEANARFFGKPAEEIIGRDDFDLMLPETARACRASDEQALKSNRPVTNIEPVNGRFYETLKFPVPLEGKRIGIGGYIRDVTEKFRAEERMRLQSAALEASANTIVITDRQAVIQWANPAFSLLTGYPPEEAIGKNPRDLVKSGVQGKEFYEAMWNTILSGQVWRGVLVNRRKDGTLYDEEMTITPVPDISGVPQYFIAVKQDISGRKRAEKALQESEAHYRSLFEDSSISLWEEDFSQVKKRIEALKKKRVRNFAAYFKSHPEFVAECARLVKILNVNQATLALYEADGKEELLKNLDEVLDEESFDDFRLELTQIAEGKTQFQWEGVNRTLGGRHLDVLLNWRVVPGYENDLSRVIVSIIDITRRKQTEKALLESERRYHMLAEISPVGIFRTDTAGQTTYVNPRWCEISGLSAEAALGDGWLEAVHPEDRERLAAAWKKAVGEQAVSTSEYRFLKPDGSVAWVIGQAVPEKDIAGNIVGYVGTITDITERKLAEQTLMASEERYRMLAENISDTIWLLGLDLRLIYASPSVYKTRGYTFEELKDLPFEKHLTPESLELALKTLAEVLSPEVLAQTNGPITRHLELEFYCKDGSTYWSDNTFTLIRNPDGTPRSILCVGRDITERKKTQEALENSEKRFRALIENSSDVIVLLDPRGRQTYYSPSYWKVTGRISREDIGRNFLENIHPEDRREAIRIFNEARARPGYSANVTFRCSHKEKGWRWLEGTITNLLGEPAVQSIVLNLRDITERRLAEENLAKRLAELETLHENGLALSGLLDVDEICQQLIRALKEKMHWHHLAVRLLDPKTNEIRVAAFSQPGLKEEEKAAYIARLNEKISRAGQGMSGWVIEHGEPVRSGNIGADERYIESFPGIRSGLYVPLKTGKHIIGSIAVESTEADAFSEEEERLLMTVAAQAAIAIENAHSYQNAIHTARRNAALHQASLEIVSAGNNLENIYAALHHAVERIMPVEAFSIAFVADPGQKHRRAYFVEKNGSRNESACPLEPFNLYVLHTGQSLLIRNMKEQQNLGLEAASSCSYLAAPLISGDKIIGVISIRSEQPDQYSVEDQAFLETLAADAVIAIENARLFVETQKRLRYISALHQIDAAISASIDLRVTLGIILDTILQELNLDAAALLLANPFTQTLEYVASKGFRAYLVEGMRVRIGEGLPGKAALQRKPLSLEEAGADTPDIFENENFVSQFAIPLIAKGQVQGVLHICLRSALTPDSEWTSFLTTLAGQTAIAVDNAHMFEDLQRSNLELRLAYDATIQGWSNALDLRDEDTEGHSQRVTELTLQLASAMNVPETQLEHIRRGALLHDIGKIAIPDSILRKPAALTPKEWDIMRRHPLYAYDLLSPIEYLQPALDIPYCHHEKWDGTGYPRGLKGEQIPLAARIFAVADVWDALTSDRPYRKAWSKSKALDYIREQAGKHFDPKVVEAFLKIYK